MRFPAVSLRALLAGLAAATTAGLAAPIARADTQAIDATTVGTYPPLTNNGFNYYQQPGNYTFTWDFTANSPVQVTQLGYYDSALAGTQEPDGFGTHVVTLFDVTADTTLARAIVDSNGPATGVFNYEPITSVTLNTTDTYEVSGSMTDQYYLVGLNQAAAPTASQINYAFGPPGNIFGSPAPAGTYGDFGPNFQFVPQTHCTENVPGRDVIALAGDVCTAAPGAYNPTITSAALPVIYNGFGFYAHGGTINSPGAISITTSDPSETGGSYGVWADTTASQINLNGTSTITTVDANSHGVYASGGGQINSPGALSVSTTGDGAVGVYASGAGSTITAALGAISTTGANATGAQADAGGSLTLTGGTISTSGAGSVGLYAAGANSQITATNVAVSTTGGNFATAVYVTAGGAITMNGGSAQTAGVDVYVAGVYSGGTLNLTGTSITATGLGSGGLFVNGTGGSLTGNNLTVVTHGNVGSATGFSAPSSS